MKTIPDLIRNNKEDEEFLKGITGEKKFFLTISVVFFFVFTVMIFIPYDIFLGNQSDFPFSFADFWWIMASMGLLAFTILDVVLLVLPKKIFPIILSLVFSLTLCAYIQRMFLNIYITSVVGEKLNVDKHPVWTVINLLIWISIILGIALLLFMKYDIWKNLIYLTSNVLIGVQIIALIIVLVTGNAFQREMHFTNSKLYELSSENNIIVFVLDTYSVSYTDVVDKNLYYDNLDGFTFFDNTTAVYSRTYPAVPYLLTGKEQKSFQDPPFTFDVENAYSESSFLPYLKFLGFDINIYTPFKNMLSERGKVLVSNCSSQKIKLTYFETFRSMLKCGLYFEVPYLLKPSFWFYDEYNDASKESTVYTFDDAKLYQNLLENRLIVGNEKNCFKFIHMFGAHNPYTINENVEKVPEGVQAWQQWIGCMKIVYEYLDQMKELGVYDSSTIIITADHGYMEGNGELTFSTAPILFVKPANAVNERLKISHAPVSHTDFFPTIIQAAGGDYLEYGSPVFSINENAQRERLFHYMQLKNWNPDKIVDYRIFGDVKDFNNWEIVSG